MKKIILFISTLMLFINSVKAEEYSDWVEWLDDSIKYDDIQTETRYRFYKEEIEGEYLISDTLNKYKYNNIDNYIYSEFSNWQDVCDGEKAIIENKILYPYKKLIVDTNYIHLYGFAKDISINDIKVFSNEIEVPYTLDNCSNCVSDYSNISSSQKLILKLNKSYPSNSLSFYIDVNNEYPNIIYKLMTTYDIEAQKTALAIVINSNLKKFIPDNRWYTLAMESEVMYSEVPVIEDDNTVTYPSKNMCRYQDKMTYYYNINKVYYDNNYYTNIDGYIKDTNDYKVYYRYLIKDNENKIEDSYLNSNNIDNTTVKDNLVIESNDEENIDIKETITSNNPSTNPSKTETKKKEVPIVNTMSINKQIPIIKYIILIVIILTLVFIFYQNKKYRKKCR